MDFGESLVPVVVWTTVGALVILAASLLVPIMNPTIIEYPWQFPSSDRQRQNDKKKVVLLAGSYNPPHNGHVAMLEHLSKRLVQQAIIV
jgi:bifunctional ADP-heptose synthase (sugar kinase/adenylyltransferase)